MLGGCTYFNSAEYDGNTVSRYSLERIRYAARLHRFTGKPILATGGTPPGQRLFRSSTDAGGAGKGFRAPVKWVEETSNNTRENAYRSFAMLKKWITHIMLVTHAWHMPRAAKELEQAGLVSHPPAATAFTTCYRTDVLAFIPTAGALQQGGLFMHKIIGMLWYRLLSAPDPA